MFRGNYRNIAEVGSMFFCIVVSKFNDNGLFGSDFVSFLSCLACSKNNYRAVILGTKAICEDFSYWLCLTISFVYLRLEFEMFDKCDVVFNRGAILKLKFPHLLTAVVGRLQKKVLIFFAKK